MMNEVHEYQVFATPEDLGEMEVLLNSLGKENWELYPIPFPVQDKPVLVFKRSYYTRDNPEYIQDRVNSLVEYLKAELADQKVDESVIRTVVEHAVKELL